MQGTVRQAVAHAPAAAASSAGIACRRTCCGAILSAFLVALAGLPQPVDGAEGWTLAGASPTVPGSTGVLMFTDLPGDRLFQWSSFDPVLSSVDTPGLVTATTWMRTATLPERLVFTGRFFSVDGSPVAIYGDVLFDPYNRAVVDIVKGIRRLRYLLKTVRLELLDSAKANADHLEIGHWGADVRSNELDGYAARGGALFGTAAGGGVAMASSVSIPGILFGFPAGTAFEGTLVRAIATPAGQTNTGVLDALAAALNGRTFLAALTPPTAPPNPTAVVTLNAGRQGDDLVVSATVPQQGGGVVDVSRRLTISAVTTDPGLTLVAPFQVKNHPGEVFADLDPNRFLVRFSNPLGNRDPNVTETLRVSLATGKADNTNDDLPSQIELRETGINSGIFESEALLATTADLPTDPDDAFAAFSGRSGGTVADEALNDRTHRSSIDGDVSVAYPLTPGFSLSVARQVCDRAPEQRRVLQMRIHVFNEPFEDAGYDDDANPATPPAGAGNGRFDFSDLNGNGRHDPGEPREAFTDINGNASRDPVTNQQTLDAQLARANIHWAQACIRVVQLGNTIFEDAPRDAFGFDILEDGIFSLQEEAFDDGGFDHDGDPATAPFGAGNARFDFNDTDLNTRHSPGEASENFTDRNGNGRWDPEDEDVLIGAFAPGAVVDVAEVFFLADLAGGNAITRTPSDEISALGERTFIYMRPVLDPRFATLAHEIGHALDNRFDEDNPPYIFYPANSTFTDDSVNRYRRITHEVEINARTVRPAGNLRATGNRLLKAP